MWYYWTFVGGYAVSGIVICAMLFGWHIEPPWTLVAFNGLAALCAILVGLAEFQPPTN